MSADWTQEADVVSANHAQFPEIAFDGNRWFVVYHYNSVTVGLPRVRVVLLTKCATDLSWASYPVDPPAAGRAEWDQIIAIGNPAIALNREENIVHVAFAEVEDAYMGEYDGFEDLTNGDLFWSWMEYETCP